MNTENTTEQTATAMPRPCGKVMSEAEMGVAWDRKMGDTIWFAGIKQAGYLYTESEVRAAMAAQQPAADGAQQAVATLQALGYTWEGGERWKPPVGPSATPLLDLLDKTRTQAEALCTALEHIEGGAMDIGCERRGLALGARRAIDEYRASIAGAAAPAVPAAILISERADLDIRTHQPAASGEQHYRGPLRTPAGDPAWIPRATPPQVGKRVRVLMDAGRVGNSRHPGYPDGKWEEVSEASPAGGLGGVAFLCELTQTGCVTHWMPLPAGPAGTTGGAQA